MVTYEGYKVADWNVFSVREFQSFVGVIFPEPGAYYIAAHSGLYLEHGEQQSLVCFEKPLEVIDVEGDFANFHSDQVVRYPEWI